ncbi:MAG TPA: CpsD/CapB family tyrosine-protein kinase [Edaphobacter sp.]|jgi:protein-tyrosine kinase|nr:CpsD/CapB family tyrosine-protein kinase [Edaphobacter sp.]
MSRIYEALQKAESERQQERQQREPEPPEHPVDVAPQMRVATALAEYDAAAVAPMVSEVYAPPTTPENLGGINLGAIVKRPWILSIEHLPALQERGPSVEQFRSLRSRIFELRDIKPLKSILVTSGLPQEGKSFISTNLAISLARHKNSKVLLIDGDMRRYSLHELLGCESHPGLADYLAGKASIEEIMQQQAAPPADETGPRATFLQNLTFIAGGNGGDKAADLSGNPRFGELMRLAAPHFDWIIVDSSPVLPVSDAVNLARSCDGVLLVARGGVTKYPVAQRATAELRAANVLGFVLNAVLDQPQVGSYYGYDATKD